MNEYEKLRLDVSKSMNDIDNMDRDTLISKVDKLISFDQELIGVKKKEITMLLEEVHKASKEDKINIKNEIKNAEESLRLAKTRLEIDNNTKNKVINIYKKVK